MLAALGESEEGRKVGAKCRENKVRFIRRNPCYCMVVPCNLMRTAIISKGNLNRLTKCKF